MHIQSIFPEKQGMILHKHSIVISLSECHAVMRFVNIANHTPYLFSSFDPGVSSGLSPCGSSLRLVRLIAFTCYVFFSLLASGTFPPFHLDFYGVAFLKHNPSLFV